MARFATNVAVCLDNEEAAIRFHGGWLTPSSSRQIAEFQTLRETWARRERAAATNIGNVQVRWIPGHKGIAGNTRADTLAKQACDLETTKSEASIASANRLLEERYNEVLASYWDLNAPKRYKDLQIGMSSRIPPEIILLPRRSLGKLLSARSGHGDFAGYHRRFNHSEANLYCSCGHEKSPEHPFPCPLSRREGNRPRKLTRRCLAEHVNWTLSTKDGAQAFHNWMLADRSYES
ncbi:hypothetical protein K3495_g2708 [Podosphaera aphanis]|nr:hypothetical protein K3495_g2708 [Podosphaera aphanis]